MKKNGMRTVKEVRPMIKAEVDAFVVHLMEAYPEIASSIVLRDLAEKEVGTAIEELRTLGKVLTNKERWG